ncbi:MAG: XTP/dITP diphosphatase [Gammaproteobacteria bacterium]|nr:XTP/dITP diphosphatase [Gammaproteobacteria bacterium]
MKKVVLASGNKGKVREFHQLLKNCGMDVRPQTEFGVSEAVEDGLSFVENAIKKARHAAAATGLPALADDSGLAVDALNGAPGIYSARFAGVGCSDTDNWQLLLEKLKNTPDVNRTARFQCVIVYMSHAHDPTPVIAQGSWEGVILRQPQGENGFGYDPIFFLPTLQCTAAQLDSDDKNRLSHRGKALQLLLQQF